MDLLQLEYFVRVAESDTMLQAAELMSVAQSTLSMSIKKLETELGVKLFRRSGHSLALTDAGQTLLRGAQHLLREAAELRHAVMTGGGARPKHIMVAMDAVDFGSEAVFAFSSLHPGIPIQPERVRYTALSGALLSGTADLCISLRPVNDPQVESVLLLSEPMYLLASHRSRFAGMTTVRMYELQDEILIAPPKGNALRELFDSYYASLGIRPKSVMEVSAEEAMASSASRNFGVTFVPRCAKDNSVFPNGSADDICARPMQESFCYRNVFLSRRRDAPLSEEVAELYSFLIAYGRMTASLQRFPAPEQYRRLEPSEEAAPPSA